MEAPGGDAAPAGFCKGKSVGRAPQALPQPAGHFLLLLVLPLPPFTHLPLRSPAPHAAPQGAEVPEWNHVSEEEQSGLQGEAGGGEGARRSRRERPTDPNASWGEGRSGEGGPGGTAARTRCPCLTPARRCPARSRGTEAAGAPSSARPAPGQRSRAGPPAPRECPAPRPRDPQGPDPRGSSPGGAAPPPPGGLSRRAAAGLGAPGGNDGPRRSASGPHGRRPHACSPRLAPGLASQMQAPPPGPPAGLTGPRPGPRGGGRSPGVASGARRARARAAAAATGPRAAAATAALSRHRPRRPPPRARPLAPPRPEPPPGLGRRRRPPLRFVFPSPVVPPPLSAPRPDPRSGAPYRPSGPALVGLRTSAAPSARPGRRQGPEPEGPAPHASGLGQVQVETPGSQDK
ncbi:proline-rich protein 2-like [Equus quagga]|uniref:proline-rich protein 2-like n=1 Tax=Equus quagga TaxID=89248 RepID=UPI001EE33FFF|nr:proline-rich protein 2-like [Equus quagga]